MRALAQEHAINPMTVSKAYNLLESEGWLERRRGLGMVIAPRRQGNSSHRWALLEPSLQTAAQQAVELGLSDAEVLDRLADCLKRERKGRA